MATVGDAYSAAELASTYKLVALSEHWTTFAPPRIIFRLALYGDNMMSDARVSRMKTSFPVFVSYWLSLSTMY